MKVHHLVMVSLGGVIGTGLFFNTGYIISTTGAAMFGFIPMKDGSAGPA